MNSESLLIRYQEILNKIKKPITLIAVSKAQPIEMIKALYDLGHRDFGENYVQELVPKARELEKRGCNGIQWHFIGHLQRKKVKSLIPFIYSIHSIDSLKLGEEVARRWREEKREGKIHVFIQVNMDQEQTKSGLPPDQVMSLVNALSQLKELSLRGLMCIPAPQFSSSAFKKLRDLELQCQPKTLGELSMGMSANYESAIHYGATHIRLGTAVFGERK